MTSGGSHPLDQQEIETPAAANHCPEGHHYASHHAVNAPIWVKICMLCGHIDGDDLKEQVDAKLAEAQRHAVQSDADHGAAEAELAEERANFETWKQETRGMARERDRLYMALANLTGAISAPQKDAARVIAEFNGVLDPAPVAMPDPPLLASGGVVANEDLCPSCGVNLDAPVHGPECIVTRLRAEVDAMGPPQSAQESLAEYHRITAIADARRDVIDRAQVWRAAVEGPAEATMRAAEELLIEAVDVLARAEGDKAADHDG